MQTHAGTEPVPGDFGVCTRMTPWDTHCSAAWFMHLGTSHICVSVWYFSLSDLLHSVWWALVSLMSPQFSSVTKWCPTLCDPMNRSTPGLPVHHHLLEFIQTHVHRVRDAIQPSHPRSSPSPPALNPSQHQGLFQWVNSLHEVVGLVTYFQVNYRQCQVLWSRDFHISRMCFLPDSVSVTLCLSLLEELQWIFSQ